MRYFLITYIRKPGGQIDERATAAKRCRTSDLTQSNVILDYGLRKVDKCVIEGKVIERSFDQLHEYYKKIYPQMIEHLEKEGPSLAKRRQKAG